MHSMDLAAASCQRPAAVGEAAAAAAIAAPRVVVDCSTSTGIMAN